LKQRDQWSNYILALTNASHPTEHYLQSSLEELVAESLVATTALVEEDEVELVELYNFAASNLVKEGQFPLEEFIPLDALPAANSESLPQWLFLVSLLLSKLDPNNRAKASWLKRAVAKNGFPPANQPDKEFGALCKQFKNRRDELVNRFLSDSELLEALCYIRLLPSPELDRQQWHFLTALCHVLHALNAELLLAFSRFRLVDYTQTGAAAGLALGSSEEPTDLALALDNVINHILVDEFQDTSQLQLELLRKLTAGWEPDDGRSLFLVGDAMQSCYGFRNANVGIYLSVRERGIGELSLTPLALSSNFRSQEPVVSWVNDVFSNAFPRHPNISRGAVPYSPAQVIHPKSDGTGVRVKLLHHESDQRQAADLAEAQVVAEQASALQQQFPDDSIAILVRTRPQLQAIVPALRAKGLQWRASDIDRLAALPVIEDLLSLVRVVINPGDQLGWLSLLRAPWCGLSSGDLLALSADKTSASIWQAVQHYRDNSQLSQHAREILGAFSTTMIFTMASRGKRSLRQNIEASWGLLRGINGCRSELELESVARFLDLLDEQEVAGGLSNFFDFQDTVYSSFVPSTDTNESSTGLHLMTMHKSKGLEYDHVLLPSLSRPPRHDDKTLLVWHQRLNSAQESHLFLAGVTETGSEESSLYQLIRYEHKHKQLLESTRLLYIAVTRAKKSATLFANVVRGEDGGLKEPGSGTLLKRIWPQLEGHESVTVSALGNIDAISKTDARATSNDTQPTLITRLNQVIEFEPWEQKALELPSMNRETITSRSQSGAQNSQQPASKNAALISGIAVGNDQQSELPSILGTLVHRVFETYVSAPDRALFLRDLKSLEPHWRLAIRYLDLQHETEDEAIAFIHESVRRTLETPSLAWVFDDQHLDSECELELSQFQSGQLRNFVIDRTFVDQNDIRWVIDYKTSKPSAGQTIDSFVAEQRENYRSQLDSYRSLFRRIESRPIRTALLLTAIPELVEMNS
jgi:ATP-dependent exoDNAse (exonuclease V) beta subunit